MTRFALTLLPAFLLAGLAGCDKSPNAIEGRSSVRGAVTVAGKPAAGVIVRFHLVAGTADGRAPRLVETLTDSLGNFSVSQNSPDDGMAPGQYTVSLFWPVGGDPEAPVASDQLKGRYLKPERNQILVEVPASSVQLPPFALK